jgi:hypothetical protein
MSTNLPDHVSRPARKPEPEPLTPAQFHGRLFAIVVVIALFVALLIPGFAR